MHSLFNSQTLKSKLEENRAVNPSGGNKQEICVGMISEKKVKKK